MTNRSLLPEFARAMLDPGFYPERPKTVELLQTQMSFVFLAGEYVYKVKKPVNLGYLDYSTLEFRRHFCERETALNRRLCPEAYLGVEPIVNVNGRIAIGEIGEPIEYAVKMRYLPQERMLNVLLVKNEATAAMIDRLSSRLADFHRRAETNSEIASFGDIATVSSNAEENFDQTEKSIGRTISPRRFERIRRYCREFTATNESLFKRRVAEGRIRDCHGDLHAAHICLTDSICIYDCIEFNDRFRYGDVASEIAFLAMDLDHYGRADLSNGFVHGYVQLENDGDLLALLPFYKCYRAYVRGKVESFKLDDRYLSREDKDVAMRNASGYFDLASFYTRPRLSLFITVGVTGTGKTTAAEAIAKRTGLLVISSDVVRKQLAGIPPTERRLDGFDAGIYSADFTRRTYDTILKQAREILASGHSVILDATFIRKSDRLKAREVANEAGADYFVLVFSGTREAIERRLAARSSSPSVSDGRVEILGPQMKQFERVDEVPGSMRIDFDVSQRMEDNVDRLLEALDES